jgi:hypothetical protein
VNNMPSAWRRPDSEESTEMVASRGAPSAPEDFSLAMGGPLYQLYLRTRLARPLLNFCVAESLPNELDAVQRN